MVWLACGETSAADGCMQHGRGRSSSHAGNSLEEMGGVMDGVGVSVVCLCQKELFC